MNPEALTLLPSAERTLGLTAFLLTTDGSKKYIFQYNPQSISNSRTANYSENGTIATSTPHQDYSYTSGRNMTFSNLLLESYSIGKSLRPILGEIQSLMIADIAKAQYEPPTVYFSWGSELSPPSKIIDFTWDVTLWLGGEPARADVSLTLLSVPQEPSSKKSIQTPDTKTSLTKRQQNDAVKLAKAFVGDNLRNVPLKVSQAFRSGKYDISVDSTGDITIEDGNGKVLATIGTFNGLKFQPSIKV